MVKTPCFKRLILRAVLRQVSPMVIRLVSVADQMPLHEFHDVLRTILGWNGRAAPPEDCAGGLDYLKTKRENRICREGALPGFRPTMKSPSVACSSCFNPKACSPTSRSISSPTAARTYATCNCI